VARRYRIENGAERCAAFERKRLFATAKKSKSRDRIVGCTSLDDIIDQLSSTTIVEANPELTKI